ncbi:MAG: sulfur transferase domain-containing protein [Proteobacteria bacterium]|nr:sulfur transferase domain-containing protein [Pseudomonadota bacterium]
MQNRQGFGQTRFLITAFLTAASLSAGTAASAAAETVSTQPAIVQDAAETADFVGGIFASNQVFLAGQPLRKEALVHLKQQGVTHVVNLRTPEEINNPKASPVNVEETSRELGLAFTHLPAGGEAFPFAPAMVDTLAGVLAEAETAGGKVLLHCASGRRATHLWVAYLIRYQHLSADEAVAMGREASFGELPLEGFLGTRLHYSTDPSSPAAAP